MSRFDGTGPMGQGPMTGRGMGPCRGNSPFGWRMGFRKGTGRGMGRGLGRFFGWEDYPQTKKDQLKLLKDYKKALEEELEDIKEEEANLS